MKKNILFLIFLFSSSLLFSQELKTSISYFTEQSIAASFFNQKALSPEIRIHGGVSDDFAMSFHLKHYIIRPKDENKASFYVGAGLKCMRNQTDLSIPIGINYQIIPSNRRFNLVVEMVTLTDAALNDLSSSDFIPNLGFRYYL